MTQFDNLLEKIDNELIEVYNITKTIKANGAEKLVSTFLTTIRVNIQSAGSDQKMQGIATESSLSGDKLVEIYNIYSSYKLINGQRIKRIERDNLFYEIKSVEEQGKNMPLFHYKSYIVKVDNQ